MRAVRPARQDPVVPLVQTELPAHAHEQPDPDVAERPDARRLRTAPRRLDAFDRIVAHLKDLATTRRCSSRAASRSAASARTRTRFARADRELNLVGHWSNWEEFWRLEGCSRCTAR
jgi:hypothetical protein